MQHFEQIWVADGSILEALFRKLKSQYDCPAGQLAGKICTVIELGSQLPVEVWFTEEAKAHDAQFLNHLLSRATAKTLLILDRGFYDFEWWSRLIAQQTQFICAAKSNLAYSVIHPFSLTPGLKDCLIQVVQWYQTANLGHLVDVCCAGRFIRCRCRGRGCAVAH